MFFFVIFVVVMNETKNMRCLNEKIAWINHNVRLVNWDEDLTLIENPKEREILEYKRILQDCVATIECEGRVEKYVNQLSHYTEKLYKKLN